MVFDSNPHEQRQDFLLGGVRDGSDGNLVALQAIEDCLGCAADDEFAVVALLTGGLCGTCWSRSVIAAWQVLPGNWHMAESRRGT